MINIKSQQQQQRKQIIPNHCFQLVRLFFATRLSFGPIKNIGKHQKVCIYKRKKVMSKQKRSKNIEEATKTIP
jgi:hypothetical protein